MSVTTTATDTATLPSVFKLNRCLDAKSAATFIERLGTRFKSRVGVHFWADCHALAPRVCWVTTNCRVLGVGPHHQIPNTTLATGEYLLPFSMPWRGSGKDVAQTIQSALRRIERSEDPNYFLYLNDDNMLVRPIGFEFVNI